MKFKKEIGSTFIEQDNDIYILTGVTKKEREKEKREIAILEKKEGIIKKDYSIEGLRKRLNKLETRNDH